NGTSTMGTIFISIETDGGVVCIRWSHVASYVPPLRIGLATFTVRLRARKAPPTGWRGAGYSELSNDRRPRHTGCDLFEQPQPFPANTVLNTIKPVELLPGRAKLWTKPAPTGSATPTNTIGTAGVACCNAATSGVLLARITSGASATNSAAYLRMRSGSPAAQR